MVSLAAATSPIWWLQATGNEVYGFNLLFISMVLLLLVHLLKGKNIRPYFLLLAYLLGLAFTNHLQTALLFPPLFLLYFFHRQSWNLGLRTWILAGLLFCLGLSTYFYLPIRSSAGPLADWGATSDWGNFVRHITGWQYRVYMFAIPFERMLENGRVAVQTVAAQLPGLFWLLLGGLFFLHRPPWKILLPLSLYSLILLIYNAGYDIPDIDFYHLPAIFMLFLAAGAGAFGWFSALSRLKKWKGLAAVGFLVFLFFSTGRGFSSNWKSSDQSLNRFAQESVENIFASVPGGGLVFTKVWDHYAPWLYNHFVLGRRPDLVMLNVNLTNRSWYLDFLKRTHPEITKGLERKIDSVRSMIRDFERDLPYDPATIESAYQSMLASLLRKNFSKQSVYFDVATRFDSATGWSLVPEGAVFRVYDRPGYYPYRTPPLGFSQSAPPVFYEDKLVNQELQALEWMLALRRNYEKMYGPKSPAGDTRNRP